NLANVTARQLFRANSAVLLQAFKDSVVLTDEDTVDFRATFLAIRDRIVPRGIDLRFYERAPPGTWPDSRYVEGTMDHPVRDVSVEDATAFALFRGRYVPTETQWEYAARGRRGLDWPWGNDGSLFDERVNGGQARTDDTRPRTVSVYQFASGASWLGAFQMLGNVSEWTSSFLDAYPDGVRTLPGAPERQVVVRGGSAFDQERYLTRPAFRGWLETDPYGAPRINQRRAWTGIRTARYGSPARVDAVHGRVPTMHFRGRKYRRLEASTLQPTVYAGFEGLHTERFLIVVDEDPRLARRKPRPGVKTMVINPLATVSLAERGRWRPNTDEKLITAAQLAAQPAPVLYALLHTDVHLVDMWHAADDSQRVFAVPSRFRREDVSPGTYFVASIGGYLCLLTTDMRDVWYVSNRPAPEAVLNVIEQRYLTPVRAPVVDEFRLRSADRLNVDIKVPMHPTASPGRAARVTFQLRPDELETRRLIEVQERQGSR
ncbi:MAG: SUMF1/EgtB/PvdO family nonheme iron enzyme, partial [Planctomycetota bacterium]|nr:SUMF1/EgtB/PvdO family nonheme iron enzyme [Planctomycetota bacterium]